MRRNSSRAARGRPHQLSMSRPSHGLVAGVNGNRNSAGLARPRYAPGTGLIPYWSIKLHLNPIPHLTPRCDPKFYDSVKGAYQSDIAQR